MSKRCPLLGGICEYTPVLIGMCPNRAACERVSKNFPPIQEKTTDAPSH